MKTRKTFKKSIFLISMLTYTILLFSCSPKLQIFKYSFIYNGKSYTIKSSNQSGKSGIGNQIIGEDFIAIDIDQDRIIDKISKGETNIDYAQEVYDYCLQLLEKSGKLKVKDSDIKRYHTTIDNYSCTIKFFNPNDTTVFTEFNLSTIQPFYNKNLTNIYLDKNADTKLDEILQGTIPLKKAQKEYEKVIQEGVKNRKLKLKNGILMIR